MKFSVTVTLKKDVLDPQGKVVQNTLKNMNELPEKHQTGQALEIDVDETNIDEAEKKIDVMCRKLLVNLIIEDYTINRI